jgi:hypothetical protein
VRDRVASTFTTGVGWTAGEFIRLGELSRQAFSGEESNTQEQRTRDQPRRKYKCKALTPKESRANF